MVAREHVLGLVGEVMNMAAARHSDDDFLDVNALVRTTSAKFRPPNRGNSMQLYKYLIQINHHKFVSLSHMICTIDVKAQVHASDIEMTFVFLFMDVYLFYHHSLRDIWGNVLKEEISMHTSYNDYVLFKIGISKWHYTAASTKIVRPFSYNHSECPWQVTLPWHLCTIWKFLTVRFLKDVTYFAKIGTAGWCKCKHGKICCELEAGWRLPSSDEISSWKL